MAKKAEEAGRRGTTRCWSSCGTRLAGAQRGVLERFVAGYFGQVDPEDLAERALADLYGAALSHWNFARTARARPGARARVQPDDRRARLAVDAHDHRDRQRRHAVPRRLGDDGGQPARAHAAPHRPSDPRRAARRRRHARERRGRRTRPMRGASRSSTSRSIASSEPDAARRAGRRRRRACSATSRLAVTDWKTMRPGVLGIVAELERNAPPIPPRSSPRARRSSRGWPTTTSRSSATAATTSSRSTARTRCGSFPARASASCAGRPRRTQRRGELRGAAAGGPRLRARPELLVDHQVERALDRAPPGLPRLRRRQALRCAPARSAASTASSASTRRRRTARSRPTFRCCGARSPNVVARAGLARGSHAGKALVNILDNYPRDELFQIERGRRCCARRSASCIWASGSGSGCSCAATRSSASSPA